MSKLYTKEMFLIAAEKCEVSMIDAKHIMQYIDEYVTPIELPTDEEMNKILYPRSDEYAAGYYGAINMIEEQLKGGNNES